MTIIVTTIFGHLVSYMLFTRLDAVVNKAMYLRARIAFFQSHQRTIDAT